MLQDLAATGILRTESSPRYNEFRELLRFPRVQSFEKLTDNPARAEEIRRVYDNDIDRVE